MYVGKGILGRRTMSALARKGKPAEFGAKETKCTNNLQEFK